MTTLASGVTPQPSPAAAGPDLAYLAGYGYDRVTDTLQFPVGAPWHCLGACAHRDCERPSTRSTKLCHRCTAAWRAAGGGDVHAWAATAPPPPERRTYDDKLCAVGCVRPAEASGLCKSCAGARRKTDQSLEEYLATGPSARPTLGTCVVRVCRRLACEKGIRLCNSHRRQWAAAQRPRLAEWAHDAPAIYTRVDAVPLHGLLEPLRLQVLIGYECQLRAGWRIAPAQVKSAVVWLSAHRADDLRTADLPAKGSTTAYLRLWRRLIDTHAATPPSNTAGPSSDSTSSTHAATGVSTSPMSTPPGCCT